VYHFPISVVPIMSNGTYKNENKLLVCDLRGKRQKVYRKKEFDEIDSSPYANHDHNYACIAVYGQF